MYTKTTRVHEKYHGPLNGNIPVKKCLLSDFNGTFLKDTLSKPLPSHKH